MPRYLKHNSRFDGCDMPSRPKPTSVRQVIRCCTLLAVLATSAVAVGDVNNSSDSSAKGREASPAMNGAAVIGVRPGVPVLFKVPASGPGSIAYSATGMPSGLNTDQRSGIITGRLDGPRDYVMELEASNSAGAARRQLTIRVGDRICLTPPMGWNSWYCQSELVGEDTICATAHTRGGRRVLIRGHWFLDSTGDGVVGHLVNTDYEIASTGHLGSSNRWNLGAVEKNEFQIKCLCEDDAPLSLAFTPSDQPAPFPRCPWAVDLSERDFPGWGSWRDRSRNADQLDRHGAVLELTIDSTGSKPNSAALIPPWDLDLHTPDPSFDKVDDPFIAQAHFGKYDGPFWAPYRCLYSRNVSNLFMADRDISVNREALGGVRVMRTCGTMGEIVGMATSICRRHSCNPRDVYTRHLSELKGAGEARGGLS